MFSNKRWLLIPAFLMAVIVMAACAPSTPAATAEPTDEVMTEEPTDEATPEVTEEAMAPMPWDGLEDLPFEGLTYTADCEGQESSTSPIKELTATDETTVTFTLCRPDPAFQSKIAFSAFAIQPREWIEKSGGTGDLLSYPIGTGPYALKEWKKGESITMTKFADYWGEPAQSDTLVFRWATESAARLTELQAGTVDGIDNVGPEDLATVEGDPNLALVPRDALNTFYLGMTNTKPPFDNLQVRQAIAMGIDKQRIVDSFMPPGSTTADYFTPAAIANASQGDAWYEFDPEAAKALLAEAGYPDGFATKLYYRDVVRGYLPNVNQVAADIQAQLKENLNIDAEIVKMESGDFIAYTQAGDADGPYLLGWGADFPHITNFLDVHFGAGNKQFGDAFPEIYEPLTQGGQIAVPEDAADIYTEANNQIRELVPMVPIAHASSSAAYLADVGTPQASPLTSEEFFVSKPGDRDTFVWMQNAEPISLYCADESDGESLRACEQINESLLGYVINGTEVEPSLATGCEPNEDLTVWVCTLREGVKFHNGFVLNADDVVQSLYVQWDNGSPLHKGNTGEFYYMTNLFGPINVPPAP